MTYVYIYPISIKKNIIWDIMHPGIHVVVGGNITQGLLYQKPGQIKPHYF